MTGSYWGYYRGRVKAGEYNKSNHFSIERRKKMEKKREMRKEYNEVRKNGKLGEYFKKAYNFNEETRKYEFSSKDNGSKEVKEYEKYLDKIIAKARARNDK